MEPFIFSISILLIKSCELSRIAMVLCSSSKPYTADCWAHPWYNFTITIFKSSIFSPVSSNIPNSWWPVITDKFCSVSSTPTRFKPIRQEAQYIPRIKSSNPKGTWISYVANLVCTFPIIPSWWYILGFMYSPSIKMILC